MTAKTAPPFDWNQKHPTELRHCKWYGHKTTFSICRERESVNSPIHTC